MRLQLQAISYWASINYCFRPYFKDAFKELGKNMEHSSIEPLENSVVIIRTKYDDDCRTVKMILEKMKYLNLL